MSRDTPQLHHEFCETTHTNKNNDSGCCHNFRLIKLVAMTILLASLLLPCARACSDVPPPPGIDTSLADYRTNASDLVAAGFTRSVTPDPRFDGGKVYSVKFDIYCILKGERVQEHITIQNVGQVPGLCEETQLKQGEKNIVFLRHVHRNLYELNFPQLIASEGMFEEFFGLCELDIKYPLDRSVTNFLERCPEFSDDYDYEDCIPPPTPEPVTTAEAPAPPTPNPNNPNPNNTNPKKPDSSNPETSKTPAVDAGVGKPVGQPGHSEVEKNTDGAYSVQDNSDNNSAASAQLSCAAVLGLFLMFFVL